MSEALQALDAILYEASGGAVVRGGAKDSKPDPEYRQFLKDWQMVQWAREDAAMAEEERRRITKALPAVGGAA